MANNRVLNQIIGALKLATIIGVFSSGVTVGCWAKDKTDEKQREREQENWAEGYNYAKDSIRKEDIFG